MFDHLFHTASRWIREDGLIMFVAFCALLVTRMMA
jgi:hypothetical protein